MGKYSICKHDSELECLNFKNSRSCNNIIVSTSNDIDVEVDQILKYLRESYVVDLGQKFHYDFNGSYNILDGSLEIEFNKTPISEEVNNDSLEFKLLCNIKKIDEDGKLQISPSDLNTYFILLNSFENAGKWVD